MDVIKIIEKWESSKLEFKEDISHPDSIAWEIVSFLNAEWWIILFWISQDATVKWVNDIVSFEEKIANISRNNIFPAVVLDFEIEKIKDNYIFILKVPMWKNKPYEVRSTRKKYIRVQTTKREVSREEEVRLWQASGNLKYDNILLQESSVDEIDRRKVENFVKKIYNKEINSTGIDYETLLQNLDICKSGIDDKLYPTFSGFYFFGRSEFVRKRIHSSFIICAYFKWSNIGTSEILDKKDREWTFDEIYDDSIRFIHKYNAESKKIVWYTSKIRYDYPLEAIRETLVNAMLHRDYTYTWANIRVFMFDDRLEIISPWILPDWLTLAALKSGIYQRFSRNEYITNFASKFLSKIAENLWSWVNRIREICKEWSYQEPDYILTDSELRVIYHKKPVRSNQNLSELPVRSNQNLSKRQNEIYAFILESGMVHMNELESYFQTKRQTILEHINKLVAKDLIQKEWKWKWIVYTVKIIS
jgi:ATP-dependent DNA helicase RecG